MKRLQFIQVPQEGLDKMSVSELDKYRDSLLSLKTDAEYDEQIRYIVPDVSEEIKRIECEIMWKDKERGSSELN